MSPALECATELDALLRATRRAALGKSDQPVVARFLMDAERECLSLQRALRRPLDHPASWRPGPARTFPIRDPKPRCITMVPFADRVVHHALCAELEPHLERFGIGDSYACRKGRGQHAALHRAQHFARGCRFGWAFKGDVTAYFASIPHDRLVTLLRRRVPDEDLCCRIERIVRAYPVAPGRGLPIGTLTSQHLANLYLGLLDHHIKDQLGIKGYLRYMDDFVAFGERAAMGTLRHEVAAFLAERMGLLLNPRSSQVRPVRDGVPLMGMLVFAAQVRPRPGRWRRFRAKYDAIEQSLSQGDIREEEAAARLSSQYAHLAAFDTYRLRSNHLARLRERSNRPGAGRKRLQPREPRRLLGQRPDQPAGRQSRQELARQRQRQPGVSSFEFNTPAEPYGLVQGKDEGPEAPGLRTATPVPRC